MTTRTVIDIDRVSEPELIDLNRCIDERLRTTDSRRAERADSRCATDAKAVALTARTEPG
jgi:hypothetical protein